MRTSSIILLMRSAPPLNLTLELKRRIQSSIDRLVRSPTAAKPPPSHIVTSRTGLVAFLGSLIVYNFTHNTQPAATPSLSAPLLPLTCSATLDLIPPIGPKAVGSRRSIHSSARRSHAPSRPQRSPSPSSPLNSSGSLFTPDHHHPRLSLRSPAGSPIKTSRWWQRLSLSFLSQGSGLWLSLSSDPSPNAHQKVVKPKASGSGPIYSLIRHPALYNPVRAPRHPIVLCHGLYGFDVRGPFLGLEIHYWAAVLDILRKRVGADVIIRGVPGTGSIQQRAESLHKFLCSEDAGVKGKKLNFIGHSMGGLDVRHLITNIRPKPEQYIPASLTTISTPHRGSPFMDWCNANIGVGNEYIEQAIAEARAKRLGHAEPTQSSGSSSPARPPYSLKSPLFSRPKNSRNGKGISESMSAASEPSREAKAPGERAAKAFSIESDALGSTQEGNEREAKDEQKSSLPFGLSAFTSALSSLSGSFSGYMLSLLDTPAYAMLSTKYMNEVFNPQTPNLPHVKYYSVAARTPRLAIWHPLWLPKLVLDAAAESRTTGGESDGSADALGGEEQGNDGLVSVQSAKWGEFLGVMEGCDHWDLRGGGAPRWRGKTNPATGKPYPNPSPAERDPEGDKTRKGSGAGSSWLDINRLLFNRSNAKGGARRSEDEARKLNGPVIPQHEAPKARTTYGASSKEALRGQGSTLDEESANVLGSSFSPSIANEALVGELVDWISNRLPRRDEARHAQAEERNRLISEMELSRSRMDAQAKDSEQLCWNGSDVAGLPTFDERRASLPETGQPDGSLSWAAPHRSLRETGTAPCALRNPDGASEGDASITCATATATRTFEQEPHESDLKVREGSQQFEVSPGSKKLEAQGQVESTESRSLIAQNSERRTAWVRKAQGSGEAASAFSLGSRQPGDLLLSQTASSDARRDLGESGPRDFATSGTSIPPFLVEKGPNPTPYANPSSSGLPYLEITGNLHPHLLLEHQDGGEANAERKVRLAEREAREERRRLSEADDLDRFWVALCRHLYQEGF